MESTVLTIAVLGSLVALALVREGNLIRNRPAYRRAWLCLALSIVVASPLTFVGLLGFLGNERTSLISILSMGLQYIFLATSLFLLGRSCSGNEDSRAA